MLDHSLDKMSWIITLKIKQLQLKWTKTWTSAVISRFQQYLNLSIKWDRDRRKCTGTQTYQVKKLYRIQIQIREQRNFIRMSPPIILLESQQEMCKTELTARCKQTMLYRLWLEPIIVPSMEVRKHRLYNQKGLFLLWEKWASLKLTIINSLKIHNKRGFIIKLVQLN